MISSADSRPLIHAWTPNVTAVVGALTSFTIQTARGHIIGRHIFCNVVFTVTNNGTGTGGIIVSAPSELTGLSQIQYGVARNLSTAAQLQCLCINGGFLLYTVTNGHPVTSGQQINLSAWYERF